MYSHQSRISGAMQDAIDETEHRRAIQIAYNTEHGITPRTIISAVKDLAGGMGKKKTSEQKNLSGKDRDRYIKRLELEMDVASTNLDFERAAEIRDELLSLRKGK